MYSIVTIHNYKIIQTFYNTTYANAESFWIQVQVGISLSQKQVDISFNII